MDRDACPALRRALDREGGQGIAIDYPLIVPNAMLNDQNQRGLLVAALAALPIDYVWLRVVGLGADAGPLQMSRYLWAWPGCTTSASP